MQELDHSDPVAQYPAGPKGALSVSTRPCRISLRQRNALGAVISDFDSAKRLPAEFARTSTTVLQYQPRSTQILMPIRAVRKTITWRSSSSPSGNPHPLQKLDLTVQQDHLPNFSPTAQTNTLRNAQVTVCENAKGEIHDPSTIASPWPSPSTQKPVRQAEVVDTKTLDHQS